MDLNVSINGSNDSTTSLFFLKDSNPFIFGLTSFASLFSIITNGYVICIVKVLSSKENSLAILNLSILEIASSITSFSDLFLAGSPETCSVIVQIRLSLFVIGLYSVGYVNMEIYLKIYEPFSDSFSNSRFLGILSAWSSGIVALVLIRCLGYHSMECGDDNEFPPNNEVSYSLFIGAFVFLLGLPSFLTLSFQISVFIRIIQHRRLRHRGRISLKKKKSTEISSNFSTVSSSSTSNASKDCLRVIVLKASTNSNSNTNKNGCSSRVTTMTASTSVTVSKERSCMCLGDILSDDRKMVISSGILIIVFLGGQLFPSILTIISVAQWDELLAKNLRRQIVGHCRCFVAVLHPLIYGILRENFRNLFKMLQKRRNRSVS